jgi:quercetin dioxygenase-like cupin family protein
MTQKTKDSDRARQADQATHQARHAEHELAHGGLIAVDIRAEVARLKSEPAWANGDRHGLSMVKGDGINVALMLLKKGASLQEHHTKAPSTVHLLEGRITVTANSKPHPLTTGMLLALDRAIDHSIDALEDSALILTVGGVQI